MRKEGGLVRVGGRKRTGNQGTSGKGEEASFGQVRMERWGITGECQLRKVNGEVISPKLNKRNR